MNEYRHPYPDMQFVINELIGFDSLCQTLGLEDVNTELANAILDEAGRLGTEVLSPLNRVGDQQAPTLNGQGVQQTPGFTEAYQQYVEGGWGSLTAPEAFGGQALPNLLGTAVMEIWQSANMALALCPLLGQGAIEAIIHHGSEELQQQFLPKMVTGEWTGTMNLTEPGAGSDLAAIKTRAVREGAHYRISGQKIFITWGDHQMTENIVHLVLARLPDAPAGVKGISLFIVPKFLLDDQGNPAQRNDARALSLEHKLGIHGSPTCAMSFGDEGGAIGYLIGEENRGLTYMFTMMNHARQGVGLQGLAISERAYQHARDYAKARLQGTQKDGSQIAIIKHPDVRRMLMQMRASIEAMRALAYLGSSEIDQAQRSQDPEQARAHQSRAELLTPIVKGWITELAQEVTSLGLQIHGGMGYIEETGAAQFYRDARILPIYEGTTGIQAQDLVGRKNLVNGGQSMAKLLEEMDATWAAVDAEGTRLAPVAQALRSALNDGHRAQQWLLATAPVDPQAAASQSVNFMLLFGYLMGGWLMARSALRALELQDSAEGDQAFLNAKLITVRFYCEQLLPRTSACVAAVVSGSAATLALPEEQF
ncbi:MAG: alkylation response protein AidB-like acyl-CoA dehydrogenase [Motiliproteus sp.]|jgi:alkylation response protein AidB-like acyl-CoA dehydrogenase